MSELLTLPRLSRRLGLPASWLRKEADAGRIPCLRAGSRYLFHLESVQKVLAEAAGQTRQKCSG